MRQLGFLIICLLFSGPLQSQIIFSEPLSDRSANYRIRATLDTRAKLISATELLRWRNTSRVPARDLQFHLYMNAFRSCRSTFLSHDTRRQRGASAIAPSLMGGIDIRDLRIENQSPLTDRIEFIQPDDGNIDDSTVIRVTLPEPVWPGEEIRLEIEFECRLPQIIARTGYVSDFFLVAQWFPKIGVFEEGQWNCHQFFPNSEFFADFGVYEVSITLPTGYVTGATGVLMDQEFRDSLQTLHYRAEDVHDFAFTAWPEYQNQTGLIENIQVNLLYAPQHAGQVSRYFTAVTQAIRYLNAWLMPYPYPNLTVVDVPFFALRAAGMEYPCFIVGGSLRGFPAAHLFLPEEITIHEYAHQYFYGILASDEAEEPWMDEGFTSFATHKILTANYGLHTSRSRWANIQIGQFDLYKRHYLAKPDLNRIVNPSWDYSPGTYGVYTYDKPVMVLQTLENLVGNQAMDAIMQDYLQTWKFRHPRTADFVAIVKKNSPPPVSEFLQQALFTTKTVDFEVEQVENREEALNKDWSQLADSSFTSRVTVCRRGDFTIPVEIRCIFASGDTVIKKWEGTDSYCILNFFEESPLVSVEVDPHSRIWLDLQWSNNSWAVQEDRRAGWRHRLQILKLVQQALLLFFTP